jgi:hypothetical protein
MSTTVVAQTLWEEQLPLAFLDGVTPLGRDLQGLAAALGRAVPISHLAALHPQRPFVQRSVAVRSGDLVISAVAHSGIYGENLVQEKAVFSMPFFGEKRFRVGGQTFLTRAGQDSIFLPVEPFSVETTAFSGVAFCVNPWRLARVADTMAGPEREPVAHPESDACGEALASGEEEGAGVHESAVTVEPGGQLAAQPQGR